MRGVLVTCIVPWCDGSWGNWSQWSLPSARPCSGGGEELWAYAGTDTKTQGLLWMVTSAAQEIFLLKTLLQLPALGESATDAGRRRILPLPDEPSVWQERETSHESWGQKCCLAQAWTQSTATELAPASCLILWQYRKTLVLLYEPQLTLLILSHLLCEVSHCTAPTETSQVLNINQEKKCNAVFPGLGK